MLRVLKGLFAAGLVAVFVTACGTGTGDFDPEAEGYRAMTAADISGLDRRIYSCEVRSLITGEFVANNAGAIYNNTTHDDLGRGTYLATIWLNASFAQYSILKLDTSQDGTFSYEGRVHTDRGNADRYFTTSSVVDIYYHPFTRNVVFFDRQRELSTRSTCSPQPGRAPSVIRRWIENNQSILEAPG